MNSTVLFAAVFLGLLLTSIVLWALFLRLGLLWARVPNVTTRRVLLATLAVLALQIAINILFALVSPSSDLQTILLAIVQLAAAVIVPCWVINRLFQVRFRRAVQAWLPTLLAPAVPLALALFLVRPLLCEAFLVPTNSMAPTLLGKHWRGVCPQCDQPNYCSPAHDFYGSPEPPRMICDSFHVTQPPNVDKRVHSGDRFLVAKFLVARRWDLIAFQFPEEPSTLYVKRLVGLPGEKIHIENGSVWVNGQKQIPPESICGIEYLSNLPDGSRTEPWGSKDRPAQLGEDEYFVLGDFSAQARDSRFWERGAPGHNPFAVPESYLKGVVTHTYWPPHRWRIHR